MKYGISAVQFNDGKGYQETYIVVYDNYKQCPVYAVGRTVDYGEIPCDMQDILYDLLRRPTPPETWTDGDKNPDFCADMCVYYAKSNDERITVMRESESKYSSYCLTLSETSRYLHRMYTAQGKVYRGMGINEIPEWWD